MVRILVVYFQIYVDENDIFNFYLVQLLELAHKTFWQLVYHLKISLCGPRVFGKLSRSRLHFVVPKITIRIKN
jgi:hypothetical protein